MTLISNPRMAEWLYEQKGTETRSTHDQPE